jgi:hypothetical protein
MVFGVSTDAKIALQRTLGNRYDAGMDYPTALRSLDRAYSDLTAFATGLDARDLLRPTRCFGWQVVDVLFHTLCDAQRALVALATPVPGPPDRDHVTYWSQFDAHDEDPLAGLWWTRRSTAAFRDGTGVVTIWADTAPAVVRAAGRADPDGHLGTQGYVLAVPDLLVTLVTEAVIHHLDMLVDLPSTAAPAPEALATASSTLDGLLGDGAPKGWTTEEYLLKGSGRIPLTDRDRAALGANAARFPLIS